MSRYFREIKPVLGTVRDMSVSYARPVTRRLGAFLSPIADFNAAARAFVDAIACSFQYPATEEPKGRIYFVDPENHVVIPADQVRKGTRDGEFLYAITAKCDYDALAVGVRWQEEDDRRLREKWGKT